MRNVVEAGVVAAAAARTISRILAKHKACMSDTQDGGADVQDDVLLNASIFE